MRHRPFMRPAEVAGLLGVSESRIYQLVGAGTLPHVRRGRAILIPRAAWQQWLDQENQRAAAVTQPARTD